MRTLMSGLLKTCVAMVSENRRRTRERTMEKMSLKVIPVFMRCAALHPSPRARSWAENLVRAGEIPRSLRATRNEGAIRAMEYKP